MRSKGAILFLTVILLLACVYQLSFTLITKNVQGKAEKFSKGNTEAKLRYLDSLNDKKVYPLLGYTYKECLQKEIALGLDLKGGMNVIMEISPVDILKNLSGNSVDPNFLKALDMAKEREKSSQEDFIVLFGKSFEELTNGGSLASIFSTYELKEKININTPNKQVINVLEDEVDAATANAFMVLRARIDRFGVVSPNIQRLQQKGRILLELPGIKEPERVRKLLQGAAKLEFWETYENSEVFEYLQAVSQEIKTISTKTDTTKLAKNETKAKDSIVDKFKGGLNKGKEAKTQVADVKQYGLFAYLMPNMSKEQGVGKGPVVGYAKDIDRATIDKYLEMPSVKSLLPKDLKLLWSIKAIKDNSNIFELVAIKVTSKNARPALTGDVITDARKQMNQTGNRFEVSMNMNAEGSKVWERLTKNNVGRCVAVVLDDYVYSFPVVNDVIKGGSSQISGNFSDQEASDLANVLKSGKMPAPAHIIQEAVVGPSLGQESINKGINSMILAIIFIILYVFFFYNIKPGIAVNTALMVNIVFLVGVLVAYGGVLTLPGIAGIVLTIGVSIDANILINERIREEVENHGKNFKVAVKDGYQKAYSAIIDANVVHLLIGTILYVFGTGPIRGFAITLVIGILTSLFTSIFISRLIFEWYLKRKEKIEDTVPLTKHFLTNINIDFFGKRKIFYVISAILFVIFVTSFFTKGMVKGIDFSGGRNYVVRFDQPVSTEKMSIKLEKEFGAINVKTFGGENQVRITTNYLLDSQDKNTENIVNEKLYNSLKEYMPKSVTFEIFQHKYIQSSEKVGPSIADDIKRNAVIAVILSMILIFVYIAIRFKKWELGFGAFMSLVHDTVFIIGTYSLLGGLLPFALEVNQEFIAAILTVIGYSINDTVIIFDRLREYSKDHPNHNPVQNINDAINSTLRRTFNTSFTMLIVLLIMFFLGGETIRGFLFALTIGTVIGVYSTVFIATSIARDVQKDKTKQLG